MLDYEVNQTPDVNKRTEMLLSMTRISEVIRSEHSDAVRIAELESLGFGSMDAVHLASAEKGNAEVLMRTDDKFRKKGVLHAAQLKVRKENPVTWLQEVLE